MRGNKESLTERVARNLEMEHSVAQEVLEAVFGALIEEMKEKGGILLTGFGSLYVRSTPERTARNPQSGQEVIVPARNRVKFSPGAALIRYVNSQTPSPGRSVLTKKPKGLK